MEASGLTGPQWKQLHAAVLKAFDYNSLQRCVLFELNVRLNEIVVVQATFNSQVTQLLEWAEQQGRLRELVAGMRTSVPGNPFLKTAERDIFGNPELALTATESGNAVKRDVESQAKSNPKLQALLSGRPGLPISVGEQEQRMRQAKVAIARIESPEGKAVASGFLVGPDLLLTNDHVRREGDFDKSPKKVRFRFGYARSSGIADPGATYKLAGADDWLVAHSPEDDLDYCLVRLETPAGEDPSGKYVDAPPRGWLTRAADAVNKGDVVTVLGHPQGEALMQASGIVTDMPAGWLDYSVTTLPGSSGSPVLNERWEWVGLHSRAGDAVSNRGISLSAILKDLPDDISELVGQSP